MLCQECPKKSTCTELCEKAEKYVNQDYRYQRESLKPEWKLDLISVKTKPLPYNEVLSNYKNHELNLPCLTPLQNKCVQYFYFDGLSYKEIAKRLSGNNKWNLRHSGINAVNQQLRKARAKIVQFFTDYRGI